MHASHPPDDSENQRRGPSFPPSLARSGCVAERAGQLERESVPIEIESSPHDPYFYRHAALCSAERIAKRRVRASMRPEIIRFSLPRSRCKLIGSDARSTRARARARAPLANCELTRLARRCIVAVRFSLITDFCEISLSLVFFVKENLMRRLITKLRNVRNYNVKRVIEQGNFVFQLV